MPYILLASSGMQSASSYKGACCICQHEWTAPLTGTTCTHGGYRSFLPPGSRGRQPQIQIGGHTYQYSGVETRPKAQFRDTQFVRRCLAVVEAVGSPHCGHKSPPLMARFLGFDWYRLSAPELVHDSKIFLEMVLKCLVGKHAGSAFYGGWNNDNKHRREAQIMGIFPSIWPANNGTLPWRLTAAQRQLLDTRMVLLYVYMYVRACVCTSYPHSHPHPHPHRGP